MRKPHWNGSPPNDDAHAKEIIIEAALMIATRNGLDKTNIKEVAAELGVTRQTIYRLFPSTSDLLTAVMIAAGGKILDRLLKFVAKYNTFEERAVESIVFLARRIPEDDFLKRYFHATEGKGSDATSAFSRDALHYGTQFLKAIHPSPLTIVSEDWLEELAEHMQRILLSIIIAPSERTNSPKRIRQYLNHWLKPLIS